MEEKRPPNPFLTLLQGSEIIGRKETLATWERLVDRTAAGGKFALMLEGIRGVGKTLFLKKLEQIAEHYGVAAIYVSLHEGDDEKTVVRKITEQLRMNFHEREVQIMGRPSLTSLFKTIEKALEKETHIKGVVLLLDDTDNLKEAPKILKNLSDTFLKEHHTKGWLLVVSGMYFDKQYEFEKFQLPLPTETEVEHALEHETEKAKIDWGKECLRLMIDDSGRNPFIFLTMARILYDRLPLEEKRITQAHYLKYFNFMLQSVSSLFDDLYYKASGKERKLLRILADGESKNVSIIAKKLHLPLNTVTTLALRSVKKGSLLRVQRGMYSLFNPLYGKYILGR